MVVDQIAHHVAGLFAEPLWMSAMAVLLAKAVWRRALRSTTWLALALELLATNAVVTVAGLAVFRLDGKLWTDLAMVVATAFVLGRASGRSQTR